jgi:hypothetical protein
MIGSSTGSEGLCYLEAGHCYVDADHVERALPTFDRLEVLTHDDHKLGRLDGIIIDPADRRVRFLVVDEGGFFRRHRFLLPLTSTQVDIDRPALRVDVERNALDGCADFDRDAYPDFGDDQLLTAIFGQEKSH